MPEEEQVWLWTLGPGWVEYYAKRDGFSVDLVCPPEELMDFYGVRNVMHFDRQLHTADGLKCFESVDRLVLSVDRGSGLDEVEDCPNLVGAVVDDLSSNIPRGNYDPASLAAMYRKVKAAGERLQVYAVIYTMNFDIDYTPYMPYIDVVSLWIWDSNELPQLDEQMGRCRENFPGKPIVLGLYVHDYCNKHTVPLDLVQFEFQKAREYVGDGLIDGYQILGSYLRPELDTPQAKWVRDFVRRAG